MTADRAALVEKVAQEICCPNGCRAGEVGCSCGAEACQEAATAAVDLIRAEVLEEAARVADAMPVLHQVTPKHVRGTTPQHVATAIRALKEKA